MSAKGYMRTSDTGLRDIVKLIRPNSIMVEIGCYAGESTKVFADCPNIKKLYAVDPWVENYDPEVTPKLKLTLKEAKEKFDNTMAEFNPNYVVVLQMTSEEASKKFKDKSIDIVYIDGDHRYEAVKKDIELWMPKLKDDGILSGHDFHYQSVLKAIQYAIGCRVDRLFGDSSWVKFMEGYDESK